MGSIRRVFEYKRVLEGSGVLKEGSKVSWKSQRDPRGPARVSGHWKGLILFVSYPKTSVYLLAV